MLAAGVWFVKQAEAGGRFLKRAIFGDGDTDGFVIADKTDVAQRRVVDQQAIYRNPPSSTLRLLRLHWEWRRWSC